MGTLFMVVLLFPVIFALCVAIAAFPLHLTVKMFGVSDSTFGKAIKVTLLAWVASLVIGIVMGMIGMIIPLIPHFVAVVAPFAVFVLLIQNDYGLNLVESVIVGVVQVIVGMLLLFGMFIAVLVPLGIGASMLGNLGG